MCFIISISMAEILNTTVSASMTSLSSPKQAQEPAMMNMKVETNAGVTPPPPIAVVTMAATSGSLENKKQKKKRGRPMKYDSNGIMSLTCPPNAESMTMPFSSSPPPPPQSHSEFGEVLANFAGTGFTPHVVNVHVGEDVAEKIMSFAEKGPRGVCVLSANGAISSVTLHRSSSSGGLWTYEGRYEILSLSGSYAIGESCGIRSRTGGLSIMLVNPNGHVFGGGIAGLLIAAGPIQLVLGSFRTRASKTPGRKRCCREHTISQLVVAAPIADDLDTLLEARPISQANPNSGNFLILHSSQEFVTAAWNDSQEFSAQKISPNKGD